MASEYEVRLQQPEQRALDPLAVDLHALEEQRGHAREAVEIVGAVDEAGRLVRVLVHFRDAQEQAVGLERGDIVAQGVEGRLRRARRSCLRDAAGASAVAASAAKPVPAASMSRRVSSVI